MILFLIWALRFRSNASVAIVNKTQKLVLDHFRRINAAPGS